ncbi:glycosyltransferase [Microbacterium oryzae]|uniref:Glycosyltransferase n=1 Tax=Microbacterium oryzae TaxID=743009 RepID=A0A6I6DP94_9MICO|nr:glycosyltransferase [Microbacterium oryzae]QGU26725.1 glycosyltransferase [Microbacterium oryzae]
MRILAWHVHGGWMNAFLSGSHDYLIPVAAGATAPPLPPAARAVDEMALREEEVDLIVLQRLEEIELVERLLGRVPGRDVPAVFVEHNTPKQHPIDQRHPLADQTDIPIVHVTHFNRLVWDSGQAPTVVIEHGIPDPGPLYTGEIAALGVVVNEPVRRARVTGTDLLPRFAEAAPLHTFGIDNHLLPASLGLGEDRLQVVGDLPTARLHSELARRRAYLHPLRWTSLGLSLLEAMHLAMPVLVLATTEAARAVPPEAGALSSDPEELALAARRLMDDPDDARTRGAAARAFALEHYGLKTFLRAWDGLFEDRVAAHAAARRRRASAGTGDTRRMAPTLVTITEGTDR